MNSEWRKTKVINIYLTNVRPLILNLKEKTSWTDIKWIYLHNTVTTNFELQNTRTAMYLQRKDKYAVATSLQSHILEHMEN